MQAKTALAPTAGFLRSHTVKRQRGYASLAIGVILLFILSLMSLYLVRSGILDLRTSANKARHAEALAQAEMNLEIGLAWMNNLTNRATLAPTDDTLWAACAAPPVSLGNQWLCRTGLLPNNVLIATPTSAGPRGEIYYLVATGQSADTTANAVVKQGVYFYSIFNTGLSLAPPMMGAGNIPLNGTFSVVANPNGGGPGVPVSVWSGVAIAAPSGSSATCQLAEFQQDGDCSGSPISYAGVKGPDIVDNDPDFPDDMFAFTFGVPTASYTALKYAGEPYVKLVNNCDSIAADMAGGFKGIFWVTGACTIPAGSLIGSEASPAKVVVETQDFTMNANSTFYGLMFAFDPDGNAGSITANGGARFYGTMLSNDSTSMGININGTFDMIFLKSVIDEIINEGSESNKAMARIPGSWADYL